MCGRVRVTLIIPIYFPCTFARMRTDPEPALFIYWKISAQIRSATALLRGKVTEKVRKNRIKKSWSNKLWVTLIAMLLGTNVFPALYFFLLLQRGIYYGREDAVILSIAVCSIYGQRFRVYERCSREYTRSDRVELKYTSFRHENLAKIQNASTR